MNCQKAKTIQIAGYLSSLGFKPTRIVNNNYWFKSMIRENELQASLKVDIQQNCWYDHGLGEGGNILDLVMKMHGMECVSQALKKLEEKCIPSSFSFHQHEKILLKKRTDKIQKIDCLNNKALLEYIQNHRRININTARKYCSAIYYSRNQKQYFAIGFKNDLGGWELRNKYWKGCIGSKAISTILKGNVSCSVFEGFIDFLSYLQLYPEQEDNCDFIILNSLSNTKGLLSIIGKFDSVNLFLDNDKAGKNATQELIKTASNTVDQSHLFKPFKDLNEYLINRIIKRDYG
ncbi:toprim domain-containing protein [Geofilum rhodophaeum]|uniref:toprim domain-containing protein n=1 Tax=Geofilum rhodophaeum TaxID=1965019 RepID=UPI000B524D57|nr:toprim domain-containing protein [Geofilum rhodophaeum]